MPVLKSTLFAAERCAHLFHGTMRDFGLPRSTSAIWGSFLFIATCVTGGLKGQTLGSLDTSFQVSFAGQGTVTSAVVQGDGKIVVVGSFGELNGLPRQSLVRLNPNGSPDATFSPVTFASTSYNGDSVDVSSLYSLLLQSDGKIIVGGVFNSVNGVVQNGLARFNPDGTLDEGPGAGMPANGGIYAMALQPNGKLIVSAYLATNSGAGQLLVRLNSDGTLDSTFNVGTPPDYTLSAIVVQPDGKILIAGGFSMVNGVSRESLARLNADGSLDQTYNPPLSYDGNFTSLALQPDGKLIVSGDPQMFSPIGDGTTHRFIARLNADGSVDPSFVNTNGPGDFDDVFAIALQPNGQIVIAGDFSTVAGQSHREFARLNADGSVDASFNTGSGGVTGVPYANIKGVASQTDGKVVVVGSFTFFNGIARASIARLLSGGALDAGFRADATDAASVAVEAVALQPDGKVLVGGSFSAVDRQGSGSFARLNTDGTVDGGFASSGIATSEDISPKGPYDVANLLVGPDGNITVAGYFDFLDGLGSSIARVGATGALDPNFVGSGIGSGDEINSAKPKVLCSALLSDGKILIGGTFTIADQVVDHIARLNADGSEDTTFNANPGGPQTTVFGGGLNAIVVQSDGKIVVGGSFSATSGQVPAGIAWLNSDGSLDASYNTLSGTNGGVFALAIQPDDRIIVGGEFSSINGAALNSIARLNTNGSVDETFHPGSGPLDGYVTSLALQPDGRVLVGGTFTSFNGFARQSLVRLNADGSVDTSFDPRTATPAGGVYTPLTIQPDGKVLANGGTTLVRLNGDPSRSPFFNGAQNVDNNFFELTFPNGNNFGFFSYDYFPYLYHADLGFEYFVDAGDTAHGAYLYDFASSTWFYTSPSFPFPYLYDFSLKAVLYYYPDPNNPGHHTAKPRYFYDFATGKIITK